MTENRFSGWAVVLIVVLVLAVAVGSLATGLFLGYQWGRSAGRARLPEIQFQRQPIVPVPEPGIPRHELQPVGRPYLGVTFQSITPELRAQHDFRVPQGALITDVVVGSPAEAADLRRGDIITAVEGQPVTEDRNLAQLILRYAPGDEIELEFIRGQRELSVEVVLGARMDEGRLENGFLRPIAPRLGDRFEFLQDRFPRLHFQLQCGSEPCFQFEDGT